MSEGTPGPWQTEQVIVGQIIISSADPEWGAGNYVAEINNPEADNEPREWADAHLIAAAPTIAEALKAVVYQMQANRPPSECMALALEVARETLEAAGIIYGNCPLCGLPMDRLGKLCSGCAMEEL